MIYRVKRLETLHPHLIGGDIEFPHQDVHHAARVSTRANEKIGFVQSLWVFAPSDDPLSEELDRLDEAIAADWHDELDHVGG